MSDKISKTYEITFSDLSLKNRFERFLAMLHFNSGFGHSGTFGMPLDGDGPEKITVKNIDKRLSNGVECISSVGYDVEIAYDNMYTGIFKDKNRDSKWYTVQSESLCNEGEIVKTVPSCDWNHPKNGNV